MRWWWLAVALSLLGWWRNPTVHARPALVSSRAQSSEQSEQTVTGEVRHASTVILLVLDGVRFQDVFEGVDPRLARRSGMTAQQVIDAKGSLPYLYRLRTEYGAAIGAPEVGSPMHASGPVFKSLPGYMELFAGRPANYCSSNRCGTVHGDTLVDQMATQGALEFREIALFASWPHLIHAASQAPERAVISVGRHGGTNLASVYGTARAKQIRGQADQAGAYPSKGDFRRDRYTAELAAEYLERHRPKFLFVSLGEADAWGHTGNYARYLEALRESDRSVGRFTRAMQQLSTAGHPTTLLVTTDHGRDKNGKDHGAQCPSSSRIWLVAAGFGISARGSVASPAPRHLGDVAPLIARLLGISTEGEAPLEELTEPTAGVPP